MAEFIAHLALIPASLAVWIGQQRNRWREWRQREKVTTADIEEAARFGHSTDPRSIRSAEQIARRLHEKGIDTSVHRREKP